MRHRPVRDDARYRAAELALWAHHGMPDPVERWIEVPDLGIRVRALEHGEGVPVVFVHGAPTAGANLVPLVGALSGIRAIVVDRPGCGLGEPLDYSGMSRTDLLAAIETYLTAVVEDAGAPVDLVGSSAGGMAVLHLASVRPDLVRSIVLAGVPVVRGMRLPAQLKAAATAPIARAVPQHWTTEREVRTALRAVGHGPTVAAGGIVGADMEWRLALARHTDTFLHEMRLLRRVATWRGLRSDWMLAGAELDAIEAPSLWLVGDRDPYASPERVRGWAAHATGSTVITLAGMGHLPWLDDAPVLGRLIEGWWARVAR